MRIETLIQRYLPDGGRVLDLRPSGQRAPMAFAAEPRIEVQPAGPGEVGGDLVITDVDGLASVRGQTLTVVTVPGSPASQGPLPDVLTWAGDRGGQVVEITRLLAPPVTAVVTRHGSPAEVPTSPGRPEPLPATDETWKRLAGELLLERHRAAVRDGELDRIAGEVVRLKRALKKARASTPPARRARLAWPGRRSGGDGG